MKTTQILYLILLVVAIIWVASSTQLLDQVVDGFKDKFNPTIPKGVKVSQLNTYALPNPIASGQLPYGPYAQQASVGSYPYQDPSDLPTTLDQLRKLFEDVRGFLVFEGVSISDSSDPTVQLPLTQLRADSRRLEQEITVLSRNPGIASTMTQQHFADIQEQLYFLQKKVRLFQTSGVVQKEGFTSDVTSDSTDATDDSVKTRASREDLQNLQGKIYSAILILSSSGTTDPVVQARIKALQDMYTAITDMINKVDRGIWTELDIPVFKEDIAGVLPKLGDTSKALDTLVSSAGDSTGPPTMLSQALGQYVGPDNVNSVMANLQDKGLFRLNLELGYNVNGKPLKSSASSKYTKNGMVTKLSNDSLNSTSKDLSKDKSKDLLDRESQELGSPLMTDSPFDSTMMGSEERQLRDSERVGGLDWKKRTASICEQIKMRGLDPADFGCIPKGSTLSPAYSWRGHAKMVCGRLGATLDPGLPESCGCPPSNWGGWTTFQS